MQPQHRAMLITYEMSDLQSEKHAKAAHLTGSLSMVSVVVSSGCLQIEISWQDLKCYLFVALSICLMFNVQT